MESKPSVEYVYGVPAYAPYTIIDRSVSRSRTRSACGSLWATLSTFIAALALISSAGLGYVIWPRKPDVDVRHITLEGISMHVDDYKSIIPAVSIDVSLRMVLKISNSNFFGVNYDSVVVHFSYRGDELGVVRSHGGNVPSRSEALATAYLDLEGLQLIHHASELIVDMANREVTVETVTVFSGALQVLFFRPHVEVSVNCKMLIDPKEKVVLNHDCSLDL